MAEQKRILLSVPHMAGTEQDFVREAFATNWVSTTGPHVAEFEREFEARMGLPAVALASGTAAIHLGLRLLGVGPGDRVFCSTLTFVASANPIRYLGAEPVFIDSERASWNMNPALLDDALRQCHTAGNLPKAVVVADLYGQCADYDALRQACAAYDVPILEDAAEALGATCRGKAAGTLGDVGAFSFNGNKIVTAAGGGMLVAGNRAWIEQARHWSNQAREAVIGYEHAELGYNYRMSNVLAAIGRGQLAVLDRRVEQRRAVAFRYRDAFADVPGIGPMPQATWGLHTNWLSCFLVDEREFGVSRDRLIAMLDEANVEARPVWKPMHLQPLYAGCARYRGEVAEDLWRRGICLPSSSSLSEEEQDRVVDCVRRAAGAGGARRAVKREIVAAGQGIEQAERARIRKLLAGQSKTKIDAERIRGLLEGKVAMVTGAAGSIGAELCRQIAQFRPAAIVGFEMAESALFELEREMRASFPQAPFYAEMGSIRDRRRVDEVLLHYRPSAIYHAAAYKHVPLMEAHPFEAVENNVLATYLVAESAEAHGVEEMVTISSDKAVRPSSVMGATKRFAELVLRELQNGRTNYRPVRFGNVIGSSGSVVPIFAGQIAAGGPVTVTHAEMSRYFIRLNEAAGLVLQASALEGCGNLYVLEMGPAIRIVDLAETMIELAGLKPAVQISIEFTGVRAGEKLREELWSMQERTVATGHEKIRIVESARRPFDVHETMADLREVCDARDTVGLIALIQDIVPEYTPSAELVELANMRHSCRLHP